MHCILRARLLLLDGLVLLVQLLGILVDVLDQLGQLLHLGGVQLRKPLSRRLEDDPEGRKRTAPAGSGLVGQLGEQLGVVLLQVGALAKVLGQLLGRREAILHVLVEHLVAVVFLALWKRVETEFEVPISRVVLLNGRQFCNMKHRCTKAGTLLGEMSS